MLLDGVSLHMQAVIARAARKHGGYAALIKHIDANYPDPPKGQKVKMTLERDENGKLQVRRVL